ncbi:hypothetical protein MASR1M48_17340 [Lactococcus petauri]
MIDNKTLLQKADLAVADMVNDGGYLLPAQALRFMRILIDEPTLIKQTRVIPMKAPKQMIEKIRFGSRILRPGDSGVALSGGDRVKPDLGSVELDAELFKAEVRLNDETLEDSIERGDLKDTIIEIMAQRVALDMEEVIVKGDTASGDAFLAKFDGLLKQADANVVDHSLAVDPKTTKELFYKLLKAMPSEFKRDKRSLIAYVSVNEELDYRESLSQRATVMGDKYTTDDAPSTAAGVPIMDLPTMPDGQALLTNPKNINVGIWRKIKIETDKDVSAGQFIIVLSVRFHTRFSEKTAVVKATGISVPVASNTSVGLNAGDLNGRIGSFAFTL